MNPVTLLFKPTVIPLAEMNLIPQGLDDLVEWVGDYRPECIPGETPTGADLFPHDGTEDGRTLTGNELLVELAGRNCFDAPTEVLTRQGWVRFPDLAQGIPVATFNRDTGGVEYQIPTDYIRKSYIGRMYVVDSRSVSLRVTEDHDIWQESGGRWDFIKPSNVAGTRYRVRRTASYPGVEFAEHTWNVPKELALAWATFVGYVVTEGHVSDGKKYKVGSWIKVYQRPETSAPILTAMKTLGFTPKVVVDPRNGVLAITLNNSKLAEAIRPWAGGKSHTKRLPKQVFEWPLAVRGALVDAMMAGDGTVNGGHRIYFTTSPQLAEDMQLLLTLSGKPGSLRGGADVRVAKPGAIQARHRMYVVRECDRNEIIINNKARHDWWESTEGEEVYCVTVPNRTLLIRRDGKVHIGSNCYHSYGAKAGKKSNASYIAHSQSGTVPHRSIMYHAKMTFFIAGISRRVSHELIRHYVGADRTEEGSPSQESTRYTFHPGHFIVPPRMAGDSRAVEQFAADMCAAYAAYHEYIDFETEAHRAASGADPKGLDRKRIYEAAAGLLPMQAATSLVWTANPVSLAKMFAERTDSTSDAEFQRLALQWQKLCVSRWPNLFPPSGT